MNMMMHQIGSALVVIGNGMAGMRTVEDLLEARARPLRTSPSSAPSRTSTTTASCCRRFSRAKRRCDRDRHQCAPSWYARTASRLFAGDTVVAIDRSREDRHLRTAAVSSRYDKLLIATGSRPIVPPFPGSNLPGVCAFRDIDDVEQMLGAADHAQARRRDRRRPARPRSGGGLLQARHGGHRRASDADS